MLGIGAGHTTDEDIYSSPEGTPSTLSSSPEIIRAVADPRLNVNAKLSVANMSDGDTSLAYDSSAPSSSDLGSLSSPTETQTSGTSYTSSAAQYARNLGMHKYASESQPDLTKSSVQPTIPPTTARAPAPAAVAPPPTQSLAARPRSQSVARVPSGTSLGRSSEVRPGSRSLKGGVSLNRGTAPTQNAAAGRAIGHHKTQSWDGGPIPVLQGQGPRVTLQRGDTLQLKATPVKGSETPNEEGLVPDGFGGYREPSDQQIEASRPSPIEESSPEVAPQARAPLHVRNDSVAYSEASAASSSHDSQASSASTFTNGAYPQRPLRVGAVYGVEGVESTAQPRGQRLERQVSDASFVSAAEGVSGEHEASNSGASRPRPASMAPKASLMRSPGHGPRSQEAPITRPSQMTHSMSMPLVKMHSVKGFKALEAAENGQGMVTLDGNQGAFVEGERIMPGHLGDIDGDTNLERREAESMPAEVPVRRGPQRQQSEIPVAVATTTMQQARPRSRSVGNLTRPAPESGANLDRHGTLINPAANPARRSRDLQRLLGDSRRKAASSTASDTERSPVKSVGLQRSNAVGSNAQPPAILEQGRRKEARVDVDVLLESDLVVEGGMLRGRLEIKIRKPHDGEGAVFLAQPKVRVVGFEELLGGDDTRHIFFHHAGFVHGDQERAQPFMLHGSPSLSSPENDGRMPLPCFASQPDAEGYSVGREGVHSIPFAMEVPIGKGAKGSYRGKTAHVRYIVIGSIKLKDKHGGNRSIAHFYRHVELYPYLNPAVVLSSAPRPISAEGEKGLFLGGSGKVKLVASLHRATWVAGQRVYINVAVANGTSKKISSASMTLIRTVTLYRPRPELNLGAGETTLDPDACTTSTTRKKVTEEILEMGQKGSRGFVTAKGWWTGVEARTNLDFAHHLAIPADALSISRGRHVEVAYHIRVTVGTSMSTAATVELPLKIINFVSLDPPPVKSATPAAARAWASSAMATTTNPERQSVSSDEGEMIAMVKSAEALRSPGRLEIARGQVSPGANALQALTQRAAQRNGQTLPVPVPAPTSNSLQAPERMAPGGRRSLDFIRAATARRSSNEGQPPARNNEGPLPLGLGIEVGPATSIDGDATPRSSTSSSFSGGSDSEGYRPGGQIVRRRSSSINPSCLPYEHIDVPAPSFGFPFVQLPAVSTNGYDDDDDDGNAADRTLGLNDESVDEVDLVMGSTKLNDGDDGFEALRAHDGDESVDPDESTDTVRGGDEEDEDDDSGLPGEELALPDERRPSVLVVPDSSTPERVVMPRPASAAGQADGRRGSTASSTSPARRIVAAAAAAAAATTSTPPPSLVKKASAQALRQRASNPALRSSMSSSSSSSSNRSSDSGKPDSPAKSVKKKSSFTFATSAAPLRVAANASPSKGTGTTAAKATTVAKAKVTPAELAKSTAAAATKPPPSLPSPASSHEALTPESAHGDLGLAGGPGDIDDDDVDLSTEAVVQPSSDESMRGGLGIGLGLTFDDGSSEKKPRTKSGVAGPRELGSGVGGGMTRSQTAAALSTATTKTSSPARKLRHSNSATSLSSIAAKNSPAKSGGGVAVASVRNKIALLESREKALRDFTHPSAAATPEGTPNKRGSRSGTPVGGAAGTPTSKARSGGTPTKTTLTPSSTGTPTRPSAAGLARSLANNVTAASAATGTLTTSSGAGSGPTLSRKSSKVSLASSVGGDTIGSGEQPSWMQRADSIGSFKAPMLRGGR